MRKGRGSVCRFIGDERKQRAVGNVCYGVESIPDYISRNEDNEFRPNGGTGKRKEAACTAYDQPKRADPDVLQEFVSFVPVLICINHGSDQRIIDGIPELHDNKKQRIPGTHAHNLCPEQCHGALERKTHVASKVARCICERVAYAERPLAVCGGCLFFFH